jgi:hypothetical protein
MSDYTNDKYLGFPKNETEWLKYEGHCILFCSNNPEKEAYLRECAATYDNAVQEGRLTEEIEEMYCNEYLLCTRELESDEITKDRLIQGLATIGVRCEEVSVNWTDCIAGTKSCTCICYYNKPLTYTTEFFIKDMSSFAFEDPETATMEFHFSKRLQ